VRFQWAAQQEKRCGGMRQAEGAVTDSEWSDCHWYIGDQSAY